MSRKRKIADALVLSIAFDGAHSKRPFAKSKASSLREYSVTDRELIETAAEALNTSPASLAHAGALLYAKRALASVRGASTAPSARGRMGARDGDLLAAYERLKDRGEKPTPATLAKEARTGFSTAKAWMLRTGRAPADTPKRRRWQESGPQ